MNFLHSSYPGKFDKYLTSASPDKIHALYDDVRNMIQNRMIGGADITHRTLSEMERLIPGLKEKIIQKGKNGKIVILGNGLSLAAEEIIKLFSEKEKPYVVIVDIVDYGQLVIDLFELKRIFKEKGFPFPKTYQEDFDLAKLLLRLIRSGNIKYIKYLVGSGTPPQEIRDANIVISTFGPNQESLDEQKSLLAPNGLLLSNTD